MEMLMELAKLIIPAAIVLYGMYLTVRSFATKELEKAMLEHKMKGRDTVLPIRLQAYERMCLFLERISPSNLVVRLNDSAYNAKQFQQILLGEIRNEFNHNLSQQVYMSDEAWDAVSGAKEAVITVINQAGEELSEESKGVELAKKVFEKMMEKDPDPIARALVMVKNEIRQAF